MKFITSSDRELWIVHIGEFRYPVYATPGEVDGVRHWRVASAVFLRPMPFDAICALLNPLARNHYAGFWIIPDTDFKAEKAPGVTPDYYARLPQEPEKPIRTRVLDMVEDIRRSDPDHAPGDDFIQDVWQRTSICELKTLRLIWLTLCQEMPRWLLRTHKPVDFGWSKLWTFPYRQNWKQIMLGKFPNIMAFLRLMKNERDARLEFTSFRDEMTSTDMAALSPAGPNMRVIRWAVELDPNNLWWEYVDSVEKRVLEGTTKTGYLKRYATLLHRSYPKAVEVFRRWVQQTTLPSASVCKRRGGRGQELVDHVSAGEVHPRNPEGLPVRVTTDPRGTSIRDSRTGKTVAFKASNLSEMPVVDFQARDLRDAGGNGHPPDNGGEEAAGMLVQHANGSPPSEEDVLGESQRIENRLA